MKDFKGFVRGINLGGWLSQYDYSAERLDHFIVEEDFKRIADWGMDHVRLPFDYNIVENEDGSALLEDGFSRLQNAISLCRKYGLNIVLDLHKTAGYSFDPQQKQTGFFDNVELQERFYRIWEEMAGRFGADEEHVAFELLNEVTDESSSKAWNSIVRTCIERIRRIAPRVVILVGSYWNNSALSVKALDRPYDDRIVYNFHCYSPIHFTHQGARWVTDMDSDHRESFPDSGVTEKMFEEEFAEAIEYAEANDTVLYCGEYGVIELAETEDILRWYQTIHRVFEKYGIGRAAWTYKKMDFDLVNPRFDTVRECLNAAL